MRNIIKKIWKSIMKKVVKFYLLDNNVVIINSLVDLPKITPSYSQFSQDVYINNKYFNEKNNGVFVDVGANHPINCSNSYLFELKDWKGLAIEPQERFQNLWKDKRKTECLDVVIGKENKDIIFVDGGEKEHGLSGVLGYNKVPTISQNKIEKKQRRLDQILIGRDLRKVDLLSIDVEGYEMNVLESIDFDKININIIVIENNIGFKWLPIIGKYLGNELGNNKIRRFLKSKGYKQVARLMCDDIFEKI